MKGEALFGVPRGRGKAAWGDGDAENTRARWHFGLKLSAGRSMIEMLGVLAVIGVLSAGGIWGYNQAMEKHKMNKLLSDYALIVANARNIYAGYVPKKRTSYSLPDMETMGFIPTEYWKTYEDYTSGPWRGRLKTPMGDYWYLVLWEWNNSGALYDCYIRGAFFETQIHMKNRTNTKIKKMCVALLSHNWLDFASSMCVGSSVTGTFTEPLSVAKAEEVCKNAPNVFYIVLGITSKITPLE